jgi:ATP-dependent DNA helicase RecG
MLLVQFINKKYMKEITDDAAGGNNDVTNNVTNNVTNDVTNNINKIELKIIKLIKNNNKISVQDISKKTKISLRHCKRILSSLQEKGILTRIGNTRGFWQIKECLPLATAGH